VRRPQTAALVLGLVVLIFVVALITGVGGDRDAQLEKRAGGGEPRPMMPAPRTSGIGLDNLLSGLAGAALVALITMVYTENREARQRIRARMGYVRLLSHELEANKPIVDEIARKYRERLVYSLHKYDYPLPKIEVWPEVRVNLAPLLDIAEFAALDDYYRQLQVLLDKKEGRRVPVFEEGKSVESLMLAQHADEAWRIVYKYADPPLRDRFLGFWPQPRS
jgi:hypothetical protein